MAEHGYEIRCRSNAKLRGILFVCDVYAEDTAPGSRRFIQGSSNDSDSNADAVCSIFAIRDAFAVDRFEPPCERNRST